MMIVVLIFFQVFLGLIEKDFLYHTDNNPIISNTTFITDYDNKSKDKSIAEFKSNLNISIENVTTNTDGSVEIIFDDGIRVKISKIAEKSINGLTLGCSEMVNREEDRIYCENGKFKDITTTFADGDKQYFFTYEEFGRFW